MLDLQYFLEMVDLKHRYGSNLRTSVEARLEIIRTNREPQAAIMMNGNEATPRRTSFTGSTMVKGRMSAWRRVRGSDWRGSECVT
jgi:metallophosphoesterase superfamily enzyme